MDPSDAFVLILITTAFSIIGTVLYYGLPWFLSPYIIDRDDPLPTLRPYQFIDPSITSPTQSTTFPTINDDPSKAISLIFPAYNEEKRIRGCLDPTIKYLIDRQNQSKLFSWEIIVVNDGSTDKTYDVVLQYVLKYGTDNIRLLSYDKNQGKGFAVQQGMLHARGCLILFADADGASEITHLQLLEDALFRKLNVDSFCDSYDLYGISIGSRAHLQKRAEATRPFLRNCLMYGFHFVVKYIGNVHGINDTQCGFKLFTRKSVKQTFMFQKIRRWCFDPELLMLAQKQKIPICEVDIKWREVDGSKIEPLKASLNMLRELILVRMCDIFSIWYNDMKQENKIKINSKCCK